MQVNPVEGDASFVGCVELVQEVDDGALSCARETDQGGDFTALYLHVDVVKGFGAVRIGEVDAFDFESSFDLFGFEISALLYLIVGFDDVEETLRIDQGIVDVVVDAVKLSDRGRNVVEEHDVVHDLSDGHSWVVD